VDACNHISKQRHTATGLRRKQRAHLEQNPERYDLGVVAALRKIAGSVVGEKPIVDLRSASSGRQL